MAHLLCFTPAHNSTVSQISHKSRVLLIKPEKIPARAGAECFEGAPYLNLTFCSPMREQLRLHVLKLREGTLGNTWGV